MAIPTRIDTEAQGYPQSIEWALRAAHKQYGHSIVDPTAFNIMRDAAAHTLKNRIPCLIKDFPFYVIERIEVLDLSPKYLTQADAAKNAIKLIRKEMRLKA